jgi:hypothetical protein
MTNEWQDASHALAYLAPADAIPHRTEGEAELLEHLPAGARRVLDLGSSDGRLFDLALLRCPRARGVALDFSAMLDGLRRRLVGSGRLEIVAHDFDARLHGFFLAAIGYTVETQDRTN